MTDTSQHTHHMSHQPEPLECAVCNGNDFTKLFTKKGRDFYKCNACGYQCQYPLPTEEELATYYEHSYQDGLYKLFAEEHEMKILTAQQRFDEISEFSQQGKWLDVGCSNGFFVARVQEEGMQAKGIDISKNAVEQACEMGLDCEVATIEDYDPGCTYENVTGFDIIEHVTDPEKFLLHLFRLTSKNGTLVISTPNVSSLSRKFMKSNWYFYIPEEHLNYFNPDTLEKLMNKVGFEVVEQSKTYKPLTFNYSLEQFKEYNPLIYRILSVVGKAIPQKLKETPIRMYIGEMKIVAKKP